MIVSFADVTAALWAAAAAAGVSAVLPMLIRTPSRVTGASVGTLASVIAGGRYVARHPILPGLFLLDWGITVASYYREILPVLATGLFMAGASAAGGLGIANAVGSACGMLLALFLVLERAKGMLVLGASLVYAALLFAMGAAPWLWLGDDRDRAAGRGGCGDGGRAPGDRPADHARRDARAGLLVHGAGGADQRTTSASSGSASGPARSARRTRCCWAA